MLFLLDLLHLRIVMRKIIHIDMDAFYASVEQRDFPELQGKAIVVGGDPEGRGVVATASYEARKYGVRSAMPSKVALKLCPELVFVKPRFEEYKKVSKEVRSIFARYTDLIEPLSLDEAYLDVTLDKKGIGQAIEIAKEIKNAITAELSLTASAGVSTNKFVAKIASDYKKPNGLTFIGPSKIIAFLEALPIEKFHGVGRVTEAKMKAKGIFYGKDLKLFSEDELIKDFGKVGHFFYQMVRGNDDRPVLPNRKSKSVAAEDTFSYDIESLNDIHTELRLLCNKVASRLAQKNMMGRTITLKVKFTDFIQVTRSITLPIYLTESTMLFEETLKLLTKVDLNNRKIRLLGVSVTNFWDHDLEKETQIQLKLF